MTSDELFSLAVSARESAYAPYSGFRVGAALLCKDGKIFTGCNIENASYPVCCCAERTALFKAVSEGEREFSEIAVAGGLDGVADGVYPCGICRQALTEFCDGAFTVTVKENGAIKSYTLAELLPHAFSGEDITL